ncbi:hypothetical protein, partial [Hafnia paralvei]|uniref:hypothetical protein n=1 Tax=Hafnia paralvei TaxID=546367 RepID=UPI001F27CF00
MKGEKGVLFRALVSNILILWDCGEIFRSPVSRCVSMSPLAKATDEGRQRAPLQSSCFLSETPSLLRFGIAHPGRPKLRHDIPV